MEFLGHLLLAALLVSFNLLAANAQHRGVFPSARALNKIDRSAVPLSPSFGIDVLNRSSFPKGFIFGAASSAYQVRDLFICSIHVVQVLIQLVIIVMLDSSFRSH